MKDLSVDSVLLELKITRNDYYQALSVLYDNEEKRGTKSCFINNYNPELLKAWQANTDLQSVCNYYKVVSYVAAYFLKV